MLLLSDLLAPFIQLSAHVVDDIVASSHHITLRNYVYKVMQYSARFDAEDLDEEL